MRILYQDEDIKFQYFDSKKMIVLHWNGYIHDDNYKDAHTALIKLSREYTIQKLISVTYDKFHVTPKIISWTAVDILQTLIENGLKHLAFVMSSHQLAKFAVKQFTDESKNIIPIKVFYFYPDALLWIDEQA